MPDWDQTTEQLLRQRKILPLAMTFEQFMTMVADTAADGTEPRSVPSTTITTSGIPVDIPWADTNMYLKQFDFLHDGLAPQCETSESAQRDFLEGKGDPWIGITQGWAFLRPLGTQLRSEILSYLTKQQDREDPILLLIGPAGSGKTMLARLIAYSIYNEASFPSIFLRPDQEQVISWSLTVLFAS